MDDGGCTMGWSGTGRSLVFFFLVLMLFLVRCQLLS